MELLEDKYQIEQLLGQGGMGAVYRATHLGTKRTVAVKVIHPQLSSRSISDHTQLTCHCRHFDQNKTRFSETAKPENRARQEEGLAPALDENLTAVGSVTRAMSR